MDSVIIKEYQIGTSPKKEDTDVDGWNDSLELEKGTDPLNPDSDNDKVLDGNELELGFDVRKPDTDGDGIFDGEENVQYTTKVTKEEQDPNIEPSVTISSNASEVFLTKITNVEDLTPFLSKNIPGYLGAPFEFKTNVNFTSAKMVFKYNPALATGNFRPEIYYYNESAKRLEKVPNQVHDAQNHTVEANVTHFSTYLLLNGVKWDEAWEKELKEPILGENGNTQYIDVVFSIDSSGSMSWNDPDDLRLQASKEFVDRLRQEDRSAVVDFDSYARTIVSLTTDKQAVKYAIDTIDSSGGTDLYQGLNQAVNELVKNRNTTHKRFIIFLTDGDGYWDESDLTTAKQNNITVYTIGLGHGVQEALLERIANETGGKYYFVSQASELKNVFDDTASDTIDLAKDSDDDGLPDYYETNGIRLSNGEWLNGLDYMNSDTDGDGLKDGEEVYWVKDEVTKKGSFGFTSNPELKDTDGDGLNDKEDTRPLDFDIRTRHTLMASDLTYVNLEDYVGSYVDTVSSSSGLDERFDHGLANPRKELKGWKIVYAEDSNGWDLGFAAVAIKKGDDIIIGYRGTELKNIPEGMADGLVADIVGIGLLGTNQQIPFAADFAIDIIEKYPDAHVYVTGHSLGGFLAEVISYRMIENVLHEDIWGDWFWGRAEAKRVQQILSNPDYFVKAETFNAAPFFISSSGALMFGAGAVPMDDIFSSKYDNDIFNYSIEGDPLSEISVTAFAHRIGKNVLPFYPALENTFAHFVVNFYKTIN